MSYRSTAQSDNSDNSINAPFEDNQTQTDSVSLHSDRESTTKSVEPRDSHLSYTSADYASGIPVQQATGVPLEKSKAIVPLVVHADKSKPLRSLTAQLVTGEQLDDHTPEDVPDISGEQGSPTDSVEESNLPADSEDSRSDNRSELNARPSTPSVYEYKDDDPYEYIGGSLYPTAKPGHNSLASIDDDQLLSEHSLQTTFHHQQRRNTEDDQSDTQSFVGGGDSEAVPDALHPPDLYEHSVMDRPRYSLPGLTQEGDASGEEAQKKTVPLTLDERKELDRLAAEYSDVFEPWIAPEGLSEDYSVVQTDRTQSFDRPRSRRLPKRRRPSRLREESPEEVAPSRMGQSFQSTLDSIRHWIGSLCSTIRTSIVSRDDHEPDEASSEAPQAPSVVPTHTSTFWRGPSTARSRKTRGRSRVTRRMARLMHQREKKGSAAIDLQDDHGHLEERPGRSERAAPPGYAAWLEERARKPVPEVGDPRRLAKRRQPRIPLAPWERANQAARSRPPVS